MSRSLVPRLLRAAAALLLVGALGDGPVWSVAPAFAGPEAIAEVAGDGDAGWTWPVDEPRRVLRAFVGPPMPWMPGHRGIDIAAANRTIRSPAAGVVRYAGWVVDRGVVSIDHGDGVVSSYEPIDALVAEDEPIAAGQPIGVVVDGHCATPCVHVGVRVDGEYRNPLRWLGGAQWPVLLPIRR